MSKIFQHLKDTDVIHMLAFIGGFVDSAGYIKIRGVFTSSITGNLVVACASVSSLNGVICRSCVSIAFAAGAGVSAMLALKLRLAHLISVRHLSIILFTLEVVMLAITWAVGHYLDDSIIDSLSLDEWPVVLVGCFMGAAMGFHNVAAKETLVGCPPTTVMTSTLINVASGLANTLGLMMASIGIFRLTPPNGLKGAYLSLTTSEKSALRANASEGLSKTLPLIKPLISFLIGAIIGAVTMKFGSFHCLAIPIFALLVIQAEVVMKIYYETKPDPVVDAKEQQMVYSLGFAGTNVILKSEEYKPDFGLPPVEPVSPHDPLPVNKLV